MRPVQPHRLEWIYLGEGEWILCENKRSAPILATIQRLDDGRQEPRIPGKKFTPVDTIPAAVEVIRAALPYAVPFPD
jgi:hypothetical protein